jgi:hypothetical protein
MPGEARVPGLAVRRWSLADLFVSPLPHAHEVMARHAMAEHAALLSDHVLADIGLAGPGRPFG